jgi:putative ABC transport system permease protein
MHPIISALLRSKTGAVLVAAQVALTLAIVSNALFVVVQRRDTASRPSGVDEANVFQLQYAGAGDLADRNAMRQRDLEILRALPGVVAATDTNSIPLSNSGWQLRIGADARTERSSLIAAAFFGGVSLVDALGLRLIEGTDFTPEQVQDLHDRSNDDMKPGAVIVSRQLAGKLFPGERSVIGKTAYLSPGPKPEPMRVIGVVDTMISSSGEAKATAYDSFIMPIRWLDNGGNYAVRTEPGQLHAVMMQAEKTLTALRNDRVLVNHKSMAEIRARRYRNERSGATILLVVTVGLLVVTASGIVGVASLWVSRRRKQIGVRRALGARRRDIIRYFLAENLVITTTGIAVGVGLAMGLNQLLVSKVEMSRLPLLYLGGGTIGMWALGLLAVLGPAWRASSVPPAIATRSA